MRSLQCRLPHQEGVHAKVPPKVRQLATSPSVPQGPVHHLMNFLEQQWHEHTQALRQHPRLRKRDVNQIFSIIPSDYIIHNEDHANAHLTVCCPNLYTPAAFNTWFDKDTFAVMDEDEDTIKNNMRKNLPQHTARKYKKILDYKKPLPYGYIMMKRKKKWNKGRTIVAYANTCIGPRPLLSPFSTCSTQRGRCTSAASPLLGYGEKSTISSPQTEPRRMSRATSCSSITIWSASLTPSLQEDILRSVTYLIQEHKESHNSDMHIDCSDSKKIGNVHSCKSKLSNKAHMHHLDIDGIIIIVTFSFDGCAFQAIGEKFRQICGTSMGNQVSPILSGCAIIATEITWLRSYAHLPSSNIQDSRLWIRRYADNRAILVDGNDYHQNEMVQSLASLNFYRKPVQLADEGANEFLGFSVNANTRGSGTRCIQNGGAKAT